LIYDAAHAFGVTIEGRSIAHWGDVSVFSFLGNRAATVGPFDDGIELRRRVMRANGIEGGSGQIALGITVTAVVRFSRASGARSILRIIRINRSSLSNKAW
jgi:hypothetical protein